MCKTKFSSMLNLFTAHLSPMWNQSGSGMEDPWKVSFTCNSLSMLIHSETLGKPVFESKIKRWYWTDSWSLLKLNSLGAWSLLNDSKLSTLSFSWNSFSWSMSSFLFLGDLWETTGVLTSDGRGQRSYLTYLDSKYSTQINEFEVGVHSFWLTK